MLALTAEKGIAGPLPTVCPVPEPDLRADDLLVGALALGVCGTDRSLLRRTSRHLPPGRDHLVIGHESLGRVIQAGEGSGYAVGDLVSGIVRRPDPAPCDFCRSGELDLCTRGDYTERGIAGADGYGSERYRLEPAYAIHVAERLGITGVLVEPTSIVAKAWERIDLLVRGPVGRLLVVGAGPIGLLAALLGSLRGYEVHVVDPVGTGRKSAQVESLGGRYHTTIDDGPRQCDVVLECAGALVAEAIELTAATGVTCLIAGVYRGSTESVRLDQLSADFVGHNKSLIATSSSNRRHFEAAERALLNAPRDWLEGLLTTIVPLARYGEAFDAHPSSIKSVITFNGGFGR